MTYVFLFRILTAIGVTAILLAGGDSAYVAYNNLRSGESRATFKDVLRNASFQSPEYASGTIVTVTDGPDDWHASLATNAGGSSGSILLTMGGVGAVTDVNGRALSSTFYVYASQSGSLTVYDGGTDVADCVANGSLAFTVAGQVITYAC